MDNKSKNVSKGKFGEELAAKYLKKLGYRIIERNYRYSKLAEIDIIAQDRDELVFVEVKYRSTTSFGLPSEAVGYRKLQKIYQALLNYISNTNIKFKSYRIDVISIVGCDTPEIEHFKNISLN